MYMKIISNNIYILPLIHVVRLPMFSALPIDAIELLEISAIK